MCFHSHAAAEKVGFQVAHEIEEKKYICSTSHTGDQQCQKTDFLHEPHRGPAATCSDFAGESSYSAKGGTRNFVFFLKQFSKRADLVHIFMEYSGAYICVPCRFSCLAVQQPVARSFIPHVFHASGHAHSKRSQYAPQQENHHVGTGRWAL